MARNVTVFGGSGFIGRHLVKRLAKQGWVIRVAVRRPSQATFLKPLGDVAQITPLRAKVQERAAVEAAVAGADAVVNLLGVLYERGQQSFEAVHVRGAETIARAAAEAGVQRLVQISAIGADARSEAAYARSKAAGEAAVRDAFPAATILRPSVVFGPEDKLFNFFAGLSRFSPALPLIGGGHTRFQPVYVGDVADAITTALSRSDCQSKLYEIGGPQIYSFKALLQLMLKEIHRKRLLVPVPFPLAMMQAAILELAPVPLLTRDQVKLLRRDNIVSEGALGLADLGITGTSVEVILPTYMDRYRPSGRFNETQVV